mgnify:CR=1 FL=1
MTAPSPAPPIARLAARALAGDLFSWTCLKSHPGEHAVWRADGPSGSIVLKEHRHPRSFPQELRAYQDWLPRLEEALRRAEGPRDPVPAAPAGPPIDLDAAPLARIPVATPALLAVDVAARVLALSLAPGARLSPETCEPTLERRAHAAAGRFARALHGLAVRDDDPVALVDALRARLARADDQAASLLTASERAGLAKLARDVDAFAGVPRVPCHRDFTPDNWLVSGTSLIEFDTITIVDFEHARLDAPEVDLVKLRAEVWPGRPDLEAAFLAGHGPLSADATARLGVLLALHAAATLAWAHRHGDALFRARGRQALAAALASA